MRKLIAGLFILLVLQPLGLYLWRAQLLNVIPIHYGIFGISAWQADPQHYGALIESMLIPAALIIIAPLRPQPPLSWMRPIQTSLCGWLFGMNCLLLINLFTHAAWINWVNFIWLVIWVAAAGLQLLVQIAFTYPGHKNVHS
ncbi:hypothetical protein ACA593_06980 [Lactiplantibacillus pentosus]|uniref:hypothetical protein n=1 Tax=Lactiplantibacillus pentosus TaxID=1589 RepID=UPI003C1A2C39